MDYVFLENLLYVLIFITIIAAVGCVGCLIEWVLTKGESDDKDRY